MKTDLTFLLDRSGSMQRGRDDYIGGFNRFLEDQKSVPGECRVTLLEFNTEIKTIYDSVRLPLVEPLTAASFAPLGATALFDAICVTIDWKGKRFVARRPEERPEKVIFVILTDSEENASTAFTVDDVHARITHQREVYGWEFVFLAANQDAFKAGRAMGIAMSSTQGYEDSQDGIAQGYAQTGDLVRGFRAG